MDNGLNFNGKLGLWPMIEESVALRTSKRRLWGATVIKIIEISREVSSQLLLDGVLSEIRLKFQVFYLSSVIIVLLCCLV